MSGYFYNEARSMLNQMSDDDLKKIMNNDDALNNFVQKLSDVRRKIRSTMFNIFFSGSTTRSDEEKFRRIDSKISREKFRQRTDFSSRKRKINRIASANHQEKRWISTFKQWQRFVKKTKFLFFFNVFLLFSVEETNETHPDVVLALLQSAASDLERQSEVKHFWAVFD